MQKLHSSFREEHVGGTHPKKGDPKGTISKFELFMFTRIPLKIIGVPDIPYIV